MGFKLLDNNGININEELLKTYSDSKMQKYIKNEYSRIVYVKLARILDSMNIPNKVMELYVFKEQI